MEFMKKFFAITAAVIFFLTGLVLLSPYFLGIGKVRDVVISSLSEQTQADIQVQDLKWSWFPRPSLKASKVRIHSASLDLQVPEAAAYLDLLGLLSGSPDISSITLSRPLIHYHGKTDRGQESPSLKLPPLEFNIEHGEFLLDVPESLGMRLHVDKLDFQEINMVLKTSASGVEASGECLPPYAGTLTLEGRYSLKAGDYQINLALDDLRPNEIFHEFLKDVQVKPLESGISLNAHITGKGDSFKASLKGDMPCVKIMPGEKDVLISCGHASFTVERDSARLGVRIETVKLNNPELTLSGEVSRTLDRNSGNPLWHVDLSATDVDLAAVRRKLLILWPGNHVVKTVCSIVLGGKADHASFLVDGPASSFRHLHAMLIKASLSNGRVRVPGVDLLLDQVNGDVEISGAVLHCTGLSGRMGGSRALAGTLDLGLHGPDPLFKLDLDLDADLKQLPPILHRLIKSQGFQSELALFSHVSGRARGRLKMGERLHHLETVVDVQDVKAKVKYKRLPWPVSVESGSFHVAPHAVSWQGVKASAGPHRIATMDGRVDWSGEPTLSFSNVKASISSGPLYQYLKGYSSLRQPLSRVITWTQGKIVLSKGSVSGRIKSPGSWTYSMDVTPESLFFQSPLIFGPLHVSKGMAHISQDQVQMNDLLAMSEGHEIRISSSLHHTRWHEWRGTLKLDGEVGTDMAAWVRDKGWIPDEYLPMVPADLIDFEVALENAGVRVKGGIYPVAVEQDGIGVRLDVAHDGDGLHIHRLTLISPMEEGTLSLDIGRNGRTDVRWKGSVTGTTLDEIMAHNHILHGRLSGEFSWKFDPLRPGAFKAVGELNARKFSWLWGPWQHPLDLEEVSINGKGNLCRVKRLVAVLGPEREALSLTGTVSGGVDPAEVKVDFKASSSDLSFRNLLGLVQPEPGKKRSNGSVGRAAVAERKDRLRFVGRIRFSFKNFHYQRRDPEKDKSFVYTWGVLNGLMKLDSAKGSKLVVDNGELCGLQTTGQWQLGPGDSGRHGVVTVSTPFDHVERFEDLMPCLGLDPDLIHGPFYLDLELKGRPGRWDDGLFRLRASKGKIWRLTALAKIFSVVNVMDLISGGLPDLFSTGYAYSELEMSGTIKDNQLKMEKGFIKGEGINLFGSGSLDLSSFDVDATVLVAPLKTVDAVLGKIPVVGRIIGGKNLTLLTIPVGVKGPVSDPRVIVLQPDKVGGAIFKWVVDTLKLPFELLQGDE